jgi:type II secretory pathway component GspD/PulD (secretin)
MRTFLRFTLLAACAAAGIAVAISLALKKPVRPAEAHAPKVEIQPVSAVAEAPAATPAVATAPQPALAPYHPHLEQKVMQLDAALERAELLAAQQRLGLNQALVDLTQRLAQQPVPPTPPPPAPAFQPPVAPAAEPPAVSPAEPLPEPAPVVSADGDDLISLNVQATDIRSVLELLNEHGGLNILASKSVQGTVTANLTKVDVETALAAVLKSTGFIARREGNILYVGTPADFMAMDQVADQIQTRVYRPNYIRAADLQALITPMLTPSIGVVTVSAPAEVDIPPDQVKTGGNNLAGTDVVIVRDYTTVLALVDQVFDEVDVKPRQVAIEAMILSVKLSDEFKFGVNFAALRNTDNSRLISGAPLGNLADIVADGGLKFGFLDSSLGLFVNALETIGDTNVIASPRLTCLNKQRAEIQIGEELGYISTTVTENAATQSVNFLETGTLLRIRPFIGNDGLIRLEVHPELSTGTVTVEQGMTLPNKAVTQVTTNILCPDGCTVLIGGLIREDLGTSTSQVPFFGNLPWIGPAFRQKTETVDRTEIIVLITPRIVSEPMMCEEGTKYGNAFTQRQNVYFDKMSCIAKRNYGNYYLRLARAAYNAGDFPAALRQVNLAIHFDPLNRDAILLRNDVVAAGGFEDESIHQYLQQGVNPLGGHFPDYSKRGYPWKEFEGFSLQPEMTSIDDPGQIGPIRNLQKVPPGTNLEPTPALPEVIPAPVVTP